MAEPTSTPATPDTGLQDKKPDWFVNSIQGNVPDSLSGMHQEGLFANNFSIEDPETYWGKESIQKAFSDPQSGKPRKDLFDQKYSELLGRYKTHRETELNLVNVNPSSPTITASRSHVETPQPIIFEAKEDPTGRNYMSGMGYTDPFSAPNKTLKQTAIDQGVRLDNGSYISTKDFKGQAKFAMGEKGGLLFNDQGKPYLIPVKDGEQLHQWDQIYSKTAENLGGYGMNYDLTNLGKSLVKNPINFISQSVDDLVEYGRGFMGLFGIDAPDAEKAITNTENWAKGIRTPSTEKNEGTFFNAENIIDLSQQVLWQLGSMAAVGATVTALTRNPKAGSAAAKLFMTAISAGSIAEVARDNNLTKRESALMLGALTAAYYPLMSLSEAALGSLNTRQSRAALTDTIKKATQNGVLIREAAKSPSKAGLATIFNNLKEGVKDWSLKSAVYKAEQSAPLLVGAASEAIEETAEQSLDTGVRSLYNLYSYTADDAKHPFAIDWSNELAQWGQAAVGGAIGGATAHGIFTKLMKTHPEMAYELHDAIMDGKEHEVRSFINSMHAQGRLDHNWLTPDGKLTSPSQGTSKNDQAKNVLTGMVDYLTELRDSSGFKDLYKNNKQQATTLFGSAIEASSVGKDAAEISANIQATTAELDKAKLSGTPNTEMIRSLEERLKASQDSLQKIISGKFVPDYVTEGLYNMLALSSQDPTLGKDKLSGKKFSALVNGFPESHKATQEAHSQKVAEQAETDKNATIDNPEGSSEARVQQLLTETQQGYTQAHQALTEHTDDLNSMQDENGEQIIYPQNLHPETPANTRTQELNVLKHNLIPSIQGQEKSVPKNKRLIAASQNLLKAGEVLAKVESTKGIPAPVAPQPESELLKMVPDKPGIVHSGTIPEKLQEELALRNKSVTAGVSLYSNSPQLEFIKNSVEQRLAEATALLSIGQDVNHVREQHGQSPLPEINADLLKESINQLKTLLGVTNALLAESNSNTASADMRIAKATMSLVNNMVDQLNALSEASVGTEFDGISKIVSLSRPGLHEVLGKGDLKSALIILNDIETQIHEGFTDKKATILKALSQQEYSDFSRRVYDYTRGILTLSSSDFWNAYHSVLVNSNSENFSPSDEHAIIVKQAVQGLMASSYSPPTTKHPNELLHNDSVFIEGRGGSGKTRSIVPLIVGTVQTLIGGKTFLTAANDIGDVKRGNLTQAVENFFKISDKQLGVDLVNSSKGILQFMSSPEVNGVNLIVYDEATLLSTQELSQVQLRLDQLNKQRADGNQALLKIVYTGDTYQNSIGTDKTNPDTRAIGIDDKNRHVIQRTPQLLFSFRQTNQPLFLFSSYLESIQTERGTSRPFSTEYKMREGVQIHQGYEDFISNAATYLNSLAKQGRLQEAVYITDKPVTSIDQRVLDSKVLIMSGEEAQGREWPTVIFDPKNENLFSPEFINLGVKKDYYTAATRASNYLLTHVLPGIGLESKEGLVNKIKPLTTDTTRPAAIEKVVDILGSHASDVQNITFDYSKYTVQGKNEDFPMEEETPETVAQTSNEQLTSEQKAVITKSPAEFQKAADLTKTPLTDGSKLAELLTSLNRPGLTSIHTFFTHSLIPFDEQMSLKRKAIYDINARKTIPYFISINRIGSPGYDNILREDPQFNGSYGIFIEAEPDGKHVVIGVMSAPQLDETIKTSGLMTGKDSLRLPLSSDFLSEAESLAPIVKNTLHQTMSVSKMEEVSKGIRFAEPYIVTLSTNEKNIVGEAKAKAGQVFIPASFYYTPTEINQVLKANNTSAYITKVPVRTKSVPFVEISSLLEKYIENGKFNFNADNGLSGRLYDAFWSHNTESGSRATGQPRENRISEALKAMRDRLSPTDGYHAFLDQYIEKPFAGEEIETGGNEGEESPTSKFKVPDNNNSRYFLKHYLEAKAQNKSVTNFQRAIEEISQHPYFKKGFEFNPRILSKSTEPGVLTHAKARALPQDIYNRYLEANLDFVSPPSIRVPLDHITGAIADANSIEEKPTAEQVESEQLGQPLSTFTTPDGQSTVEYLEPTKSESAIAETMDDDPVSDSYLSEKNYEDDAIPGMESESIEAFQSNWFSLPGFGSMFPDTVRTFRRDFMDYLFSTSAENGQPAFLRDINQVMKTTGQRANTIIKEMQPLMETLDPAHDAADREMYMKYVKAREFRFLVQKYFPTIYQDTKTKDWKYRSKHYKSRHFSEKESFNLLTDGMTDMVKTQLYNTPALRRTKDGWKTTGDYLWQGDIEPLVLAVRGATSTEEISAKLRESPNQAAQSVYMRFFHDTPYKLDGKATWSLSKISNPEVFKMTDALAQYVLSGNIFNLTKVDFDEQELKASSSSFASPNTVRQTSHDSVLLVAENEGKFIVNGEKGSLILGSLAVRPSSEQIPSDKDTLDAIHAIGLNNFNEQNLKDVQELDYRKLAVQGENIGSKVNSAIIDNIVLPVMYKMKDGRLKGDGSSFSRLNVLYDAIIRSSGSSNVMMDTNVDGNKRSRLQWGGPIYRINTQLEEIKAENNSVLTDNLLVKGRYKILETRIKGGFQSEEHPKPADRLTANEIADFDVIWAFAHTLKQSHADSGQFSRAMLTPLVWSDSKTDPHMVVENPKGYFKPHVEVLQELFESRKSYYNRQAGKVLENWENFLELRNSEFRRGTLTLRSLANWLNSNPISIEEVAKHPGMINNLDYFKLGKSAVIKPSFVAEVEYYNRDNFSDFIKKQEANYNEFKTFADESKSNDGQSLTQRLGEVIEGKSGESVLKAFYYNWLAFSSEFQHVTAGNIHQYKTDDLSSEFIDSVKRNKLHMANRTSQLFRNQSWTNLWQQAKNSGLPLSPEMIYEGKKLPRHGRIAYVYDVKMALSLPSGLKKDQEIYDGATLAFPTTRIMQSHSNSGNHGIYVGAVMKNVTTTYDNNRGASTGIKNAEFLVTPELMRQGTPLIQNMVKRAYSQKFSEPITSDSGFITTPWEYLTQKLGLSEDLSNAEWKQFDDLLNFLVENNQQDSLILEVAPDSSVKMARKATNSLVSPEPFTTEVIDLVNKGTQLDASHGIDEIGGVRASQIVNAISYNFTKPAESLRMLRGLAEIAYGKIQEWRDKSPLQRKQALKDMVVNAFSNRNDISYATKVTAPSNAGNFSIDDRQLITPLIRGLNSQLSDEAVLLDFDGGQFILHPTTGLIQVYDVVREGIPMTVLRSGLTQEEKSTAIGRDLKWQGEDNRAEILLPASMRDKFGIIPGTPLDEISPEYFAEKVLEDKTQIRKATLMYKSFQKTLDHIVTRIPATGKHSAVSAKVVGFVDESENAVFVPAELLFNQGADQDADKGVNFSYEVVNGLVPEVDEGFELKGKSLFPDKLRKKAIIAGIKNAVVKAMDNIMTSPETLTERNTPVDISKGELEVLALEAEAKYKFDPDSYTSYLKMRDINQSGMALRGIFSNAMKSYQIMIGSEMTKGNPTDSPEQIIKISERLGALVNAAVDNAKDQLMGKLGINVENANMVSYMVMKGLDFKTIVDTLQKYAPELEELATYKRYDATLPFRASVVWSSKPDLASVYYLGREVGQIATFAINRRLPSSDVDMIAYRKRVESFINGQYKAFNLTTNFNMIKYLEDTDYAESQIQKYASLKGKDTNGIRRSEFNVLKILKDSPHIWSYMQVYLLSHNLASESKLYKTSSSLADEVAKSTSILDDILFNNIKEFSYGVFIDQYLQNAENPTDFDLTSARGRQQFANHMTSDTFLNPMRIKYPANSFINGLTIVPDVKRKWKDATLLRLAQDLQQTSEERRMQLQADFHDLDADDKRLFVLYNLITRHGKFGKDSYGALFEPSDKAELTRFLDRKLNIDTYDFPKLGQMFDNFRNGMNPEELAHNIIPYEYGRSENQVAKIAIELSENPTLDQDTVEQLNEMLIPNMLGEVNTKTPIGQVEDRIDTLLREGNVNQMEFAYLTALKEDIAQRQSPKFTEVDDKTKSCAPKLS